MSKETFEIHNSKMEFIICQALKDNEIGILDTEQFNRECAIKVLPCADQIFCHKERELIYFKNPEISVENGLLEIKQQYKKLY